MKITLQPGEDKTLSLEGFGFYVVTADGPIIAELREIDGRIDQSGVLMPGQGLQGINRFEGVRLINMHAAAQTVQFYVGPRTFVDNRQVGVMQVEGVVSVDPVPQTLFPAFVYAVDKTAVATKYVYAELHNPAGSGKTLFVDNSRWRVSVGGVAARLVKAPSSPVPGAYSEDSINTGTASVARAGRYNDRASSYDVEYGAPSAPNINHIPAAYAGTVSEKTSKQPLVLAEGQSLVAMTYGAGALLDGFFSWDER